jgi:hypothetical protein
MDGDVIKHRQKNIDITVQKMICYRLAIWRQSTTLNPTLMLNTLTSSLDGIVVIGNDAQTSWKQLMDGREPNLIGCRNNFVFLTFPCGQITQNFFSD